MKKPRIVLLNPNDVVPHEQVDPGTVKKLVEDILTRGVLMKPVIVDAETGLLIDGHHRLAALKILGAKAVPAVLIDYAFDVRRVIIMRPEALGIRGVEVAVFEGDELTHLRDTILASPTLLPPKTTYHITWAKNVTRPHSLRRLV